MRYAHLSRPWNNSVSLKHQSTSVVVAGRFNPFIFSPDWLEREEIIIGKPKLMFGGVQGGVGFSCDGIEWQVDDRNLIVSGKNEIGDLVIKVLGLLKHTPIKAIGINFSFESPTWDSPVVPKLGEQKLSDLQEAKVVTWSSIFHEAETRILMEVAYGSEGLTVNFNYHTPATDSGSIITSVEKLQTRFENSKNLINSILKGDVIE